MTYLSPSVCTRARSHLAIALLTALCAALLVACRAPAMPSGEAPPTAALAVTPTVSKGVPTVASATPSAPAVATAVAIATTVAVIDAPHPTATATAPVATPTSEHPATPESTPLPTAVPRARLVYLHDGKVTVGEVSGGAARTVAQIEPPDAWDLCRNGLLAMVRGDNLEILDLATDRGLVRGMPAEGEVIGARVLWGARCQSLLHAALVDTGVGETGVRQLVMSEIAASDGYISHTLTVDAGGEARVLGFDDAATQVLVLLKEGEREAQAQLFDLLAGPEPLVYRLDGHADLALSTDGWRLLTQSEGDGAEAPGLFVYGEDTLLPPTEWRLPDQTHATDARWSPNGASAAVVLESGRTYGDADQGRGMWVLEAGAPAPRPVLDITEPGARLVGWTPDGALIMGYRRPEGPSGFYYVVRPDGGGYRILALPSTSIVLGWIDAAPGG